MNITVILEADERQTKRLMAVSQPKGSVTSEEVKETDCDCLHSRVTTAYKYITPTSCWGTHNIDNSQSDWIISDVEFRLSCLHKDWVECLDWFAGSHSSVHLG